MAFKVNIARSYPYPVNLTIVGENGKDQVGTFTAMFKVLPHDEKNTGKLLDHVLLDVLDLELTDAQGKVLTDEDLINAAKNDPAISLALVNAYNESIVKKNLPKS